jgi:Rrf2 family iron-sulfur cluster assembly transcriptional regulator
LWTERIDKVRFVELTRRGDYAVRVVVELATEPADAVLRTAELGRRTGVPRPYLTKIVQALARHGLVRTRRGTLGGVALLAAPESISLRRVIEAAEGPIRINRCLVRPGLCDRTPTCPVHPVWRRIRSVLLRELDAVRVADLAEAARALTPSTRREAC